MEMNERHYLLFRADGNSTIGAGHIMRCISIADGALEKGIPSLFVTAGEGLCQTIEAHGHECIILNTEYQRMIRETEKFAPVLQEKSLLACVVDSYYVDQDYFEWLRKNIRCPLVYIDDMALFPYKCDILINYNIFGQDWEDKYCKLYGHLKMPRMLLGSRYTPLRREFCLKKRVGINQDARNILISTGGADPDHFTIELLHAIEHQMLDKRFNIIVGAMNEDRNAIYKQARGMKNVTLHESVVEMARLMLANDVAISAAGSTLYELCATQTPTITYVLEDNQVPAALAFEKAGVLQNAGDIRILGAERLAEKLITVAIELCENYQRRVTIARCQEAIVDGSGSIRIVDELLNVVQK